MTRNMIRPACKVLPLLSAILPPPTCAVMTGTPAGAVAPAAPAPTTAVAAKVAAVTAATPSANDFLPIIDTPVRFGRLSAGPCASGRRTPGHSRGLGRNDQPPARHVRPEVADGGTYMSDKGPRMTGLAEVPGVRESTLDAQTAGSLPAQAPPAPWECDSCAILWLGRGRGVRDTVGTLLPGGVAMIVVGGMIS